MKRQIRQLSRALTLGAACALCATNALAERYALLVGVSDYATKPLSGPVNDVAALRKVLNEKWSFKSKNITVLLDEQGTKKNILKAIDDLTKKTQEGDDVFIYLSGHGTSANDRDMRIPLPTTSGAFIPVDIKGVDTMASLMEHLVIGRRDLQPLFMKLDKGGRHVFVAIDACYSGNTVRGFFSKDKLPSRNLSLRELLPNTRSFGDDLAKKTEKDWVQAESKEYNTYPYSNVFYLSASGEHEPAQDIPLELIRVYPTIDGKPHGAFTDTLLRVLSRDIDADINEDGQVTYVELKNIMRNLMRSRGFDHTPQGLPTMAEDTNNLSSQPIFGAPSRGLVRVTSNLTPKTNSEQLSRTQVAALDTPALAQTPDMFTVKLDPALKGVASQLTNDDKIRIADDNYQLELRREKGAILALSRSGDLIAEIDDLKADAMASFVRNQAKAHELVSQRITPNFSIDLELFGPGRGSTAIRGQDIGFSIKSTENVYIFVLDIDSQGLVSVLYPYHEHELARLDKNKILDLKNISTVTPPFGRDYILVYGFKELPDELKSLRGQTFGINSPSASTFTRLVNDAKAKVARAELELVTADSIE